MRQRDPTKVAERVILTKEVVQADKWRIDCSFREFRSLRDFSAWRQIHRFRKRKIVRHPCVCLVGDMAL